MAARVAAAAGLVAGAVFATSGSALSPIRSIWPFGASVPLLVTALTLVLAGFATSGFVDSGAREPVVALRGGRLTGVGATTLGSIVGATAAVVPESRGVAVVASAVAT